MSNSLGLSLFYLAEIQLCKIRAEEYCDEDHDAGDKKLIVFSSDNKAIELVDKTEIRVDGQLYDIVKTRSIEGKVLYYARADHDEDEYVRQLIAIEKNDTAAHSQPISGVKSFEVKYFPVKIADKPQCLSIDVFPQPETRPGPIFYPLPFKDIFSPPPDRLIS